MPYLYGFSIHRIQNYLFATNRLREILGASELVNTICEDFFTEQCRKLEATIRPENVLLQAAGNIRCVFEASERAARAKLVRRPSLQPSRRPHWGPPRGGPPTPG